MTLPDLEALKTLVELAKKATPGPWRRDVNCIYPGGEEATSEHGYVGVMYLDGDWPGNCEFVVAARNAIPALERLLAGQQEHQNLISDLADALIWASGSDDFNEGGKARKGWLKLGRPAIEKWCAYREEKHGASIAAPPVQEAGREDGSYPLVAYIWKRNSTNEWVLDISGTINDTNFTCRHTEPLTTKPEDVAGLPSLYAEPASLGAAKIEGSDQAIEAAQLMVDEKIILDTPEMVGKAATVIQAAINSAAEAAPSKLIDYFRGDGYQDYGMYGDDHDLDPEETAIHFLRQHQPIKAGWVRVPMEPTPDMLAASQFDGNGLNDGPRITPNKVAAIYKAMLSAAPE